MTQLPVGIITSSETITTNIQSIDHVAIEDIAPYKANRALINNDVGRRLENFFWRVWSNGEILPFIKGSTLGGLFIKISEGDNVIRTAPMQSPHQSSTDSSEARLIDSPSLSETAKPRQSSKLPPPILKKPKTQANKDLHKTARIAAPTPYSEREEHTTVCRPSNSASSTAGTLPTRHYPENNHGPGRKRTAFVANTTNGRRRPATIRRKHSQPTTTTLSTNRLAEQGEKRSQRSQSVQEPSPLSGRVDQEICEGSVQLDGSSRRKSDSHTLQVKSAERVEDQTPQEMIRKTLYNTRLGKEPEIAVVDDEPRFKFLDGRRDEELAPISFRRGSMKTAPVVASTSAAAGGTLDVPDPWNTLKSGMKGKQRATSDSSGADTDGARSTTLSRSQSQLTLLLERDRRHSEGILKTPDSPQRKSSS
ncbi:MAG: hypothetical protein M1819_004505 [Sarea resinae]|nr:MAG: hypothetical protein M1819_004505 [Sarea resinae]